MRKYVILLIVVLMFSLSYADTLNFSLSQVALIRNNNINRLLVKFNVSILNNVEIDYAEIVIPHFLTTGKIVIEGHRLLTNWNSSTVNWNSFGHAGGDYDTTIRTQYTTSVSRNKPIILEVTKFVENWVKTGNNYGLILKRPYYEGNGFGNEGTLLRNTLVNARLRIFYTRLAE